MMYSVASSGNSGLARDRKRSYRFMHACHGIGAADGGSGSRPHNCDDGLYGKDGH
jgi:hypothetical protein